MVAPLTAELEKRNFVNVVWFYQDELRELESVSGRTVKEIFTLRVRRGLRKKGILKRVFLGYHYGRRLKVSDEAKDILNIFVILLMVLSLPFL
ncbi:unnamed protein product [marine sediment metagenome]|uniref:Uncharacterized protein n=1 Tax=marine sediment metagenome TaxID=412755 RepID=X1V117_9ZZZZ